MIQIAILLFFNQLAMFRMLSRKKKDLLDIMILNLSFILLTFIVIHSENNLFNLIVLLASGSLGALLGYLSENKYY